MAIFITVVLKGTKIRRLTVPQLDSLASATSQMSKSVPASPIWTTLQRCYRQSGIARSNTHLNHLISPLRQWKRPSLWNSFPSIGSQGLPRTWCGTWLYQTLSQCPQCLLSTSTNQRQLRLTRNVTSLALCATHVAVPTWEQASPKTTCLNTPRSRTHPEYTLSPRQCKKDNKNPQGSNRRKTTLTTVTSWGSTFNSCTGTRPQCLPMTTFKLYPMLRSKNPVRISWPL